MDFLLATLIGTCFVGAVTRIVNAPATVVSPPGGATPTGTTAATREKRTEYERYGKDERIRLETRRGQKQRLEGNHSCALHPR